MVNQTAVAETGGTIVPLGQPAQVIDFLRQRSHLVRRSLILAVSLFALTANAEPKLKLGVMGDSLSDEYFEDPTRANAKNWLQQLAENRAIDPGPTAVAAGQPTGTWGSPRRTGYAYNWSAPWATSRTLLSSGQATSLAAQVMIDGVNGAVLAIGANDFNPSGEAYAGIYDGSWSAARILAHERRTLANIRSALITIRRTGIPLILVNVLDSGSTPALATEPLYADATKRQRVTSVIGDLNHQLQHLAQTYQIPLVDWYGLAQRLTGSPTNLVPGLLLGNTAILMQQSDPGPGPTENPLAGYVADGFHPHTTIQGVLANTIITALNSGCGANLPIFTEAEILQQAGLPYGGADTLFDRIGSYTNYVFRPVPLGPIGIFRFDFPATNASQNLAKSWHLQIEIRNKVNARSALPRLTATAQLSLPDSATIEFPEVPTRYSRHTGYAMTFTRGTNVTLNPPRLTTPITLVIRNLRFSSTNGNWRAQSGKITYRQGTMRLFGGVE